MIAKIPSRYYLLLTLVFPGSVIAQQSVLLNQAVFNSYLLNQAAAGQSVEPTFNCHYKKNWLGFTESPEITQVTFEGGFNRSKSGGGFNISNERAGIFSRTGFSAAIRHSFKLNKNANLSFGISGGFLRQYSDFSKLKAETPEELALWPSQQSVTMPDAGAGILFVIKNAQIGVSANHLLNQNFIFRDPVLNSDVRFQMLSTYVGVVRNLFHVSNDLEILGQVAFRSTHGLPVQPDISATVIFKNKITLSCGWRPTFAAYTGFGIKLTEKLTVRYFYEYSRLIQGTTFGGHELGVKAELGKNNRNKPKEEPLPFNDELAEKMDKYETDVSSIMKKMDSLDKNVQQLQKEVERLKNQQLSQEEITRAIDNYFYTNKSHNTTTAYTPSTKSNNYRIIQYTEGETQTFDTIQGTYRVVYGVYQLLNYAKQFQKLVKRETGFETLLVEIPGHPKKYLYVCDQIEHRSLKSALKQLRDVNKQISQHSLEITKGKPWILQLSKE